MTNMNTVNEKLIQNVKDSIFCELVDYGVSAGEAYDLSLMDFDPLEIMEEINLESSAF